MVLVIVQRETMLVIVLAVRHATYPWKISFWKVLALDTPGSLAYISIAAWSFVLYHILLGDNIEKVKIIRPDSWDFWIRHLAS